MRHTAAATTVPDDGGVIPDAGPLVRQILPGDRAWVAETLIQEWTSTSVARLGELVEAAGLPGHIATLAGRRAGLALVDVRLREYEILAISTSEPRRGVGRALMEHCFAEARARGCRRVWLVTTNNNVAAIAFYQRLGMDLAALHRHAVRASRELKPTIPERDATGVRIDHELEFELLLDEAT
jgi:ribosomal protein S18 acetylase RimI-like enzyme